MLLLAATVLGQGRWTKLAPFPEPDEELYGITANGKLYVIGGLLAGWLCAKGGTELSFVVGGIAGLAATCVAARRLGPIDWRLRARAQPVRGKGSSHLVTQTKSG